MFGTAGLPHILMRFYTVPDAAAARTSVNWATFFIGFFYLLTFVLGFGAMALVGQGTITGVEKGGNMAAPLLAQEVGGEPFLGFIAAVAFATILAVVAGLDALGRGGALARPLGERRAARTCLRAGAAARRPHSDVVMGAAAIILGIVLEGQNVAFMVGLAFAIAASANFPALLMAIFWRRFTTWGAVSSIVVGAVSALVLIYISPTIQEDVLGNATSLFPLKNPALISMPLAFVTGIVVSLLRPEPEAEERYEEAEERMYLGAVPSRVPAQAGVASRPTAR